MRRVGIDDSRLFSLADKPYALFAGVAPVGQATRKGQMAPMPNCQDNNPFFDVFCFGGLAVVRCSLLLVSGLPMPTSTVPLCFTASGRHWLQLQGSLKLRKVARSTFLVTRCD